MNLNLSPEAEALFAAALELSEPEQDLFLTRECREPKLRDEVRGWDKSGVLRHLSKRI